MDTKDDFWRVFTPEKTPQKVAPAIQVLTKTGRTSGERPPVSTKMEKRNICTSFCAVSWNFMNCHGCFSWIAPWICSWISLLGCSRSYFLKPPIPYISTGCKQRLRGSVAASGRSAGHGFQKALKVLRQFLRKQRVNDQNKGWTRDPQGWLVIPSRELSYCWWFRNPVNSPVEVGTSSHFL